MTQTAEIKILHETPDWIAVEKPDGLSVHNDEDPDNLLKVLTKQLGHSHLFPVHRLDKETSGVQVLALNEKAASELAIQFQTKKIEKYYQGVVAGSVPGRGVWSQALTDKGEGWKNPAGISKDRVPCETKYRNLKSSKYFSWLEFQILTGRQHQIRKHCAIAGKALIGDPRYGNPKYNQKISEIYKVKRMALHCTRLILENGQELQSEPPSEFDLLFVET